MSQYYCFYCIFDQINAALLSIRDFFQKHYKTMVDFFMKALCFADRSSCSFCPYRSALQSHCPTLWEISIPGAPAMDVWRTVHLFQVHIQGWWGKILLSSADHLFSLSHKAMMPHRIHPYRTSWMPCWIHLGLGPNVWSRAGRIPVIGKTITENKLAYLINVMWCLIMCFFRDTECLEEDETEFVRPQIPYSMWQLFHRGNWTVEKPSPYCECSTEDIRRMLPDCPEGAGGIPLLRSCPSIMCSSIIYNTFKSCGSVTFSFVVFKRRFVCSPRLHFCSRIQ